MRRALPTFTVTAVLLIAVASFAAEKKSDPPPPPPPPPSSSESPPPPPPSSEENKESDSPNGGSFRATDALLDVGSGKKRPMMLSFFLSIPYYHFYYNCGFYGSCGFPIAPGARFTYPILHDGFLPMVNDSFEIEGGIDVNIYFGAPYAIAVALFVTPRWTFHLIPKLDVYAAPINIGLVIYAGRLYSAFDFLVNPCVGAVFKLTDTIYLRGEVGTHYIRAGLGIGF